MHGPQIVKFVTSLSHSGNYTYQLPWYKNNSAVRLHSAFVCFRDHLNGVTVSAAAWGPTVRGIRVEVGALFNIFCQAHFYFLILFFCVHCCVRIMDPQSFCTGPGNVNHSCVFRLSFGTYKKYHRMGGGVLCVRYGLKLCRPVLFTSEISWKFWNAPLEKDGDQFQIVKSINITDSQEGKGTSDTNWIGHILHRNCFPKDVIEGKMEGRIEVMGRRRRRRKQLLNDLEETGGYCKLKAEARYCTVWGTRFGRSYGPCRRIVIDGTV